MEEYIRLKEILSLDVPVEFKISNLNLPLGQMALGGVETYRMMLDKVDPDGDTVKGGFELTPTRAFMKSIHELVKSDDEAHATGLLDFAGRPLYTSVHQSWGQKISLKNIFKGDLVQLGGAALLTEEHDSLGKLRDLSELTSNHVPAVVFGEHEHEGAPVDFSAYGFPQTLMQLKPEIKAVRDAQDHPDALMEFMDNNGIDALVIDNHHLTRAHNEDPQFRLDADKILGAVEEAKIPIAEIHASLGRSDARQQMDKDRSFDNLKASLYVDNVHLQDTEMWDTLGHAYYVWRGQQKTQSEPLLPVVLEIPSDSLMSMKDKAHLRSDHTFNSYYDWDNIANRHMTSDKHVIFGALTRMVSRRVRHIFDNVEGGIQSIGWQNS
jgi:hypothetical protein